MSKPKLFISLLAVAVICFTAQQAMACLCEPMSPKQRTKFMKINADAILTGKVLSTVQLNVQTWETTLLIADSWKGEASGEIKVQSSGGCRVGFVVGELYLVYGKRNEPGVLVTGVCWGSAFTSFRKDDLKQLGKPTRSKTPHESRSRSANQSPLGSPLCI